jgi:hypothetical protein
MRAPFEHRNDPLAHERAIQSLSEKSGASPAEVRAVFGDELARLKMGAKVGSYLGVLTASNVRGMLRRKASLAARLAELAPLRFDRNLPPMPSRYLERWEDDGGTVRLRTEC